MSLLEDLLTGAMLVLRECILYLSIPPNKKIKRMELLPLHLSNLKQPPQPRKNQKNTCTWTESEVAYTKSSHEKNLRPVSPKSIPRHAPQRSLATVGWSSEKFWFLQETMWHFVLPMPKPRGNSPWKMNGWNLQITRGNWRRYTLED